MNKISTLTAVACIAAAGGVVAEPVQLFGLQLGAPVPAISQCQIPGTRNNEGTDWCAPFHTVSAGQASGTAQLLPPSPIWNQATIDARERLRIPSWLVDLRIEMHNGVIGGMIARTAGPRRQAAVLESLDGKFGPGIRTEREGSSGAGVRITYETGRWSTADAIVSTECIRIDTCYVSINTPEFDAVERARLEQRRQKDRL